MKKVFIVLLFILLGSALIVVNNSNKDVKNSFKIVYENNKNEALPDLTNKIEMTDGLYRLHTFSSGVTLDYNVYNGDYIMNGTSTQQDAFSITVLQSGTYTLSFNYVSGSMSGSVSEIGLVVAMPPPDIGATYLYVNKFTNTAESKTYTHDGLFYLNIILWSPNEVYNNYTFKIQIEKGSLTTPYVVPKLVPMYYDNLSMKEKQEIGLGAFGGITKIIKTINDIIKPVGDFINGLLSWF